MSTEAPHADEKTSWDLFRKNAANFFRPGGSKPKSALAQRKAGEKKPVSAGDGRRGRSTGRTAVLNTKLKPEFREKLFTLAAERDIGIAALLEKVFEEWESKRGN